MFKKRRTFSAQFKSKVALETLSEQETLSQIASRYDVGPGVAMEEPVAQRGTGEFRPQSARLESIPLARHCLLPASAARGYRRERPTRHHEYRSGLSVHQHRLHRVFARSVNSHLHGPPGTRFGQRFHQTAQAPREV